MNDGGEVNKKSERCRVAGKLGLWRKPTASIAKKGAEINPLCPPDCGGLERPIYHVLLLAAWPRSSPPSFHHMATNTWHDICLRDYSSLTALFSSMSTSHCSRQLGGIPTKALTSFTCFPRLPANIRLQIRKDVTNEPRTVDIFEGPWQCNNGIIPPYRFVSSQPPPPVLQVNRELRHIGLEYYRLLGALWIQWPLLISMSTSDTTLYVHLEYSKMRPGITSAHAPYSTWR